MMTWAAAVILATSETEGYWVLWIVMGVFAVAMVVFLAVMTHNLVCVLRGRRLSSFWTVAGILVGAPGFLGGLAMALETNVPPVFLMVGIPALVFGLFGLIATVFELMRRKPSASFPEQE
ncbi:MAG: hypothetical protein HY360_08900 [Verrucomicrobia bacterium]|nr:hypothetical protein [Verrucomicrobiota bacterium]